MVETSMAVGNANVNNLSKFGIDLNKSGVHNARTMMLEDLRLLLSYVNDPNSDKDKYLRAILEDNCLRKISGKSRDLTARHLTSLYTLDVSETIFRTLLYFWYRDIAGEPLLAFLCAYSRDSILRDGTSYVLAKQEGETIKREALEEYLEGLHPGRFSKATLISVAQNINGTLTHTGHLTGRNAKVRTRAVATTGSVSYALLLNYISGLRGEFLFNSGYTALLDCSKGRAIDLAEEALRRGWIVFKRIGEVMEVQFPNLLTPKEMEWIREQN